MSRVLHLTNCDWLLFIYDVIKGGNRLQTDRGLQCPDTVGARKAHGSEDGDAFLWRQVVADRGGTHGAVAGGRPSVHHGGQDKWFCKVWGDANGSRAKLDICDVRNEVQSRCELHLRGLAEVGPSQELKHPVNTVWCFLQILMKVKWPSSWKQGHSGCNCSTGGHKQSLHYCPCHKPTCTLTIISLSPGRVSFSFFEAPFVCFRSQIIKAVCLFSCAVFLTSL